MTDPLQWDIYKLNKAYKEKQVSPVEVTQRLLDRIEVVDKKINAFITKMPEEALATAKKAEVEIMSGKFRGWLHGIPIGLKDVIYTRDTKTTMGSKFFKEFCPDYDATIVKKIRASGAVIIGKLNTQEFAFGPTGTWSYFGPVKNPRDFTKIPGGSSSGCAAAVLTAQCFGAIGTDTGGSIRIPSSCCGIIGMKPTFGRVSKFGIFPVSDILDHVGPMTRTVKDNAIVLNTLSGGDNKDPYCISKQVEDFTRLLDKDILDVMIGIPSTYFFENLEDEVHKIVQAAIELFRELGAKVVPVNIPNAKEMADVNTVIIRSEAYALHKERLEKNSEYFNEEVRQRLLSGKDVSAYEYIELLKRKRLFSSQFTNSIKDIDVLLTPTLPILPPSLDENEINIKGQKQTLEVLTSFTAPANLSGCPSLTIPCGYSKSGLPISIQLIGHPFQEANIYRIAYAFEQESSFCTIKYDV